ncbi:MAG: hypothetical protein WAL91_08835 [Propionicimonas sp.]
MSIHTGTRRAARRLGIALLRWSRRAEQRQVVDHLARQRRHFSLRQRELREAELARQRDSLHAHLLLRSTL